MSAHENGLRAKLGSRAQRHGRVHAELARRVRRGRNHSTLVALAADHDGLALQRWIKQLLHGNEERVHIDAEDGSEEGGHGGRKRLNQNRLRVLLLHALVNSDVLTALYAP